MVCSGVQDVNVFQPQNQNSVLVVEREWMVTNMSDYKCEASSEGMCHNVTSYGTPCSGYSEKCSLRNTYEYFDNIKKGLQKSLCESLGIHGDRE